LSLARWLLTFLAFVTTHSRRTTCDAIRCIVFCASVPLVVSAEQSGNPDRYEPGLLPAVAGDSDVGLKLGVFGQLARFREEVRPYAWRAQVLGAGSYKQGATGAESPYREAYAKIDWPRFGGSALRVMADLTFLQTTNYGYFGVGNDTHAERRWAGLAPDTPQYVQARRYYQFDGSAVQLRVASLVQLPQSFKQFDSLAIIGSSISQYEGSLLAHDAAHGTTALFGLGRRTQVLTTFGIAYDTRDHETATTRGQFHELSFRANPGLLDSDAYLGANLTLRSYVPIAGEQFSVAVRLLGDALSRRAPLSELSRYGGLYGGQGPGGARGIRGVPQGRLLGRTKAIFNLELRSLFLPFRLGTQQFCLGMAGFFDAGRVWTETLRANEVLDGAWHRVHWGTGAGPRLRWGDSLMIRADIAYAPLGADLGSIPAIYVDVDQVL